MNLDQTSRTTIYEQERETSRATIHEKRGRSISISLVVRTARIWRGRTAVPSRLRYLNPNNPWRCQSSELSASRAPSDLISDPPLLTYAGGQLPTVTPTIRRTRLLRSRVLSSHPHQVITNMPFPASRGHTRYTYFDMLRSGDAPSTAGGWASSAGTSAGTWRGRTGKRPMAEVSRPAAGACCACCTCFSVSASLPSAIGTRDSRHHDGALHTRSCSKRLFLSRNLSWRSYSVPLTL